MTEEDKKHQTMPPPHLMKRVSGNTDADTFNQVGSRAAVKSWEAVTTYADGAVRDLLDWGCGCGRVAAHIADGHPELSLSGCDPDEEAISWCAANMKGDFRVCGLYPPLPWPDGSFDAVIAISVMTHLRRSVQTRWLRELARVLRPQGVLVASVHGVAAAEGFGVKDLNAIQDHWLDPYMAGVLPGEYYHTVLQTEAYTRFAWAACFDVVEYELSGLELHDLVVCRRRDPLTGAR